MLLGLSSHRLGREELYHGDIDGQVFVWDIPD